MIDQSHNVEPKIEAMIHSVMNIQEAYAKALLVDGSRSSGRSGAEMSSRRNGSSGARSRTDVTPLAGGGAQGDGPAGRPVRRVSAGRISAADREGKRIAPARGTARAEGGGATHEAIHQVLLRGLLFLTPMAITVFLFYRLFA